MKHSFWRYSAVMVWVASVTPAVATWEQDEAQKPATRAAPAARNAQAFDMRTPLDDLRT